MATALILAIVVAVCAFGGTEPLTFSFVQLMVLVLVGLVLWKTPREAVPYLPWLGPASLLLYVLAQMVLLASAVPSGSPALSTITLSPFDTSAAFLRWVTYVGAFYLTLVLCGRHKTEKRIFVALILLGAFEALYGLIQYLSGWHYIFTYAKHYYINEATGTYVNHNHFAGLLGMLFPLSLGMAYYVWHKGRGSYPMADAASFSASGRSSTHPKTLFFSFLAVLMVVSIIFSRSRMGILAALSTILLLVALIAHAKRRERKKMLTGVIVGLTAVLLLAVWVGLEPVMARYAELEWEYNVDGVGRLSIWKDAFELVQSRPFFGSGLGTFATAYQHVQRAYPQRVVGHAHNDYLQFLIELGLVGSVLLFAQVFYVCFLAIRGWYRKQGLWERSVALGSVGGIAFILVHSLTDFNLQIPANALTFSVLLALAFRSGQPSGTLSARKTAN